MAFEMDKAEQRLDAAKEIQKYLKEASSIAGEAQIHNAKVNKSLTQCKREIARFIQATKFSITKRKERTKEKR